MYIVHPSQGTQVAQESGKHFQETHGIITFHKAPLRAAPPPRSLGWLIHQTITIFNDRPECRTGNGNKRRVSRSKALS